MLVAFSLGIFIPTGRTCFECPNPVVRIHQFGKILKVPVLARGVSIMTVLLSSQCLTKAYGPRPLFTDIEVNLRAGERVGLIGPNGSGKSTLLKLFAGLEIPDRGTIALRRT